ncbi:NAD(P)-binding protein [Polyplosphaeria fusca]|uniref:NAD(P)-binding protein n=1 Tax=Polyplosphaeria fusca TaxID=682080 RepID=A0A9P4UZ33_9PLEO|nr:NAD(P)-binding protein [Polyplosphaeria fusca]
MPIEFKFEPHMGIFFPGESHLHHDIYPSISPLSTSSLTQPQKSILITGAGRGIGRATALQYAHASATSLTLCSRTLSELSAVAAEIRAINPRIRVHTHALDVTCAADVQRVAAALHSAEGRLDVLVNNAGASAPWVPLGEGEPGAWWNTLEVNLKGPYLAIQAFLPLLTSTAERFGTVVDVVNVGSAAAHQMLEGSSAYSISKFALLRLTEFVHEEYGAKGVNCIALQPGGIVSKLSDQEPDLQPYLSDTADLPGGFITWVTAGARTWMGGRYFAANWDVDRLLEMKDEIVEGGKLKVRMVV